MSDVENIADHMALTCHCGSVRFCLLRSGRVECASCQDRPGVAWHHHDDPANELAECEECCGKGWNDLWRKVDGHYDGGETFREQCEVCNGEGRTR